MKIRMNVTQQGSTDGMQVNTYEAGRVYDLPLSLAEVFLSEGWAREDKAIDKVPEVKASGTKAKSKADNSTSKRTSNTGSSKKSSKD